MTPAQVTAALTAVGGAAKVQALVLSRLVVSGFASVAFDAAASVATVSYANGRKDAVDFAAIQVLATAPVDNSGPYDPWAKALKKQL